MAGFERYFRISITRCIFRIYDASDVNSDTLAAFAYLRFFRSRGTPERRNTCKGQAAGAKERERERESAVLRSRSHPRGVPKPGRMQDGRIADIAASPNIYPRYFPRRLVFAVFALGPFAFASSEIPRVRLLPLFLFLRDSYDHRRNSLEARERKKRRGVGIGWARIDEGLMGKDRRALGERCCASEGGTARVGADREDRSRRRAGGTESEGKEERTRRREEKMVAEARRMLGVGKTGERTEDIELKWPLGAHSSIPLSLP